jgi:hypothetical protein
MKDDKKEGMESGMGKIKDGIENGVKRKKYYKIDRDRYI